jgi:phosphoglycolate phosphatase-like HAD superfamily hydrolase
MVDRSRSFMTSSRWDVRVPVKDVTGRSDGRYSGRVPRLVLWDVDHTLIENAGVSKEIYSTAFAILTGQDARHAAQTDGRTDREIMAGMIAEHGGSSYDWPQIMSALGRAGVAHRGVLAARGIVLPGVVELVTALAERPDVVQTVVTGNVRANAQVKLGALGLARFFDLDVGGYGSDHVDRYRLVESARERAAAKYGPEYGEAACAVVIGDTPRDVEAARLGGADILAVASGLHSVDELRAAGACQVVADLADTTEILDHLIPN